MLAQGRSAAEVLDQSEPLGQEAFAGSWNGRLSDWRLLQEAAAWLKTNGDIRELASRMADRAGAARAAAALADDGDDFAMSLGNLFNALKLDRRASLGADSLADLPHERLAARLGRWLDQPEALSTWVGYRGPRAGSACA